MKKIITRKLFSSALSILVLFCTVVSQAAAFRPPAVPLVACDPYFSIWSPANNLNDSDTVHWTGKPHRLTSLVTIDGKTYRLMGAQPSTLPPLPQTSLKVLPTRTIYHFGQGGIEITVTFLTPMLPEDLEILSRPVTYLTWEAKSKDGHAHEVAFYIDAGAEIAVNMPQQAVTIASAGIHGLAGWKVGSAEQQVLQKRGDDLRIDWGYLYLVMPTDQSPQQMQGSASACREAFLKEGRLAAANDRNPWHDQSAEGLAVALATGKLSVKDQAVSRTAILAYDDLYSIQYMKKNLRPYWRKSGWEAADLLKASAAEQAALARRCAAFDAELMEDTAAQGGEDYAQLCALAFRQCFAAGKFVADSKGEPLQFCKENHSNGCIGTSDVFYPMAPQFLLFGPTLAKSFLVPFMNYAASDRWKFNFAPHDLGTYPQANGQVYGGGERTEQNQMPVEESGNLLILMAAIGEMEGKPDFANLYWPQLEKWAAYLKAKGFDPENQLCTDDFAGHLAHNVNLSAKAICGLGAFARLSEMRGDKSTAEEYFKIAREFAQRWTKEAAEDDHYRLAFDKPGTWSQKYNLIWDKILKLDLFPADVATREMTYYRKIQNKYGLPLDNRKTYTKLDWILWTATLTRDREDFQALLAPVMKYLNETPNRSPMSDWYDTLSAKKVGFTARPVVGGVFAQMLYSSDTWQKYAKRDQTRASGWAAIPVMPRIRTVVPAADSQPGLWRYTTTRPSPNWSQASFDDSTWQEGKGGFGTSLTPGGKVGTTWNKSDIWLRREMDLPSQPPADLLAWIHHDEDAEIFVNGVLALRANGFSTSYDAVPFSTRGLAAFHSGKNIIAIHCHQTTGGQFIDLGLVQAEHSN